MQSHNFTVKDVEEQQKSTEGSKSPNKIVTSNKLKELLKFEPKSDNKTFQELLNKPIEQNTVLCVEKDGNTVNIIEKIREGKTEAYKITYQDVLNTLTSDDYKLSPDQARHVLVASNGQSISGGKGPLEGLVIAHNFKASNNVSSRPVNMSKVIIGDDGNVSLQGGQKIMFDAGNNFKDEVITNHFHAEFKSRDYIVSTIEVKLGKIRNDIEIKLAELTPLKFTPETKINIAGTGKIAEKIMGDLKEIKSEMPKVNPDSIERKYAHFVSSVSNTMQNATQDKEKYQAEVRQQITNLLKDPTKVNKDTVNDLKNLEYSKEAFATIIADSIEKEVKKHVNEGKRISAEEKKQLTEDTVKKLKIFSSESTGYLERLAKDVINETDKGNYITDTQDDLIVIKKKGAIEKIVSKLKDSWYGYEKISSKTKSTKARSYDDFEIGDFLEGVKDKMAKAIRDKTTVKGKTNQRIEKTGHSR